jgi:hypothetical protein
VIDKIHSVRNVVSIPKEIVSVDGGQPISQPTWRTKRIGRPTAAEFTRSPIGTVFHASGYALDAQTQRPAGGRYSLAWRPRLESQCRSRPAGFFRGARQDRFNQGEITGNIWMTKAR